MDEGSAYSMSLEPVKNPQKHSNRILVQEASSSESSSDDWIVSCPPHRGISSGGSSDCIEFVNSDGEVIHYEDDDNGELTEDTKRGPSPRNPLQYMVDFPYNVLALR
jgi:hypothetical protein